MQIIRNLLEACAQFKFFRDQGFVKYFQEFSEITPGEFAELTAAGAEKIIIVLWGVFSQAWQCTTDYAEFMEKIQ